MLKDSVINPHAAMVYTLLKKGVDMTKLNRTLKERLQTAGLRRMLSYLDKDPDKHIPKLIYWAEKSGLLWRQIEPVKKALMEKDSNWYKLVKSFWTDIDKDVRKTAFENFLVNATMIGCSREVKASKTHQCNIPWAILMDPTSACNLKCIGCWASEYGHKWNLSYDELDDIIEQGKELGTFMYIYSGGEPLMRKNDIIKLCEAHPDCEFLAFTNGTLIDEEFADEMLRVKNFVPAISVEGFREATDARRGKGTYDAVIRAMDILKRKKLPFGISCCYTSENTEVIGSHEFIDAMIDKGVKFAWLFTYMPVGKDAVVELIATAKQREYMYHTVREFRKTKPIFIMDFWNDGEYVNGCIAGGRCYLHINSNGDIEPCAFIHYSDSNIRDKTLLEAYKSPLFMSYRKHQPFNQNMLMPCPLLDNPDALCKMVDESGAYSTEVVDPEDVGDLTAKTEETAKNWEVCANKLWSYSNESKNCRENDKEKVG